MLPREEQRPLCAGCGKPVDQEGNHSLCAGCEEQLSTKAVSWGTESKGEHYE